MTPQHVQRMDGEGRKGSVELKKPTSSDSGVQRTLVVPDDKPTSQVIYYGINFDFSYYFLLNMFGRESLSDMYLTPFFPGGRSRRFPQVRQGGRVEEGQSLFGVLRVNNCCKVFVSFFIERFKFVVRLFLFFGG